MLLYTQSATTLPYRHPTEPMLRHISAYAGHAGLVLLSSCLSVAAWAEDTALINAQAYPSAKHQISAVTPSAPDLSASFHSTTPTIAPNAVDWYMMASAYSPALAIEAFTGDWNDSLSDGDLAYIQGRSGLTLSPSNSTISYGIGWRYDYLMTFSPQTAQVYWNYENEVVPTQAMQYPLYIEANHNERVGANIAYRYDLNPAWQIRTQANLWQGLHALEGQISGQLTTRSLPMSDQPITLKDSVDNADLWIDYHYDKPALREEALDWNPPHPNGYGYSFDVAVQGQLSDNTTVHLTGYDLLGRMHWDEMPSTRYELDYDVMGRPLYNLEGKLDTDATTQQLPWRVEGSVNHRLSQDNRWNLGVHAQANTLQNLYQLSAGYRFDFQNSPLMITGLVEPQTKSLGMAVEGKYGGIKVLMDDVKFDDARRSELSLYGQYAW